MLVDTIMVAYRGPAPPAGRRRLSAGEGSPRCVRSRSARAPVCQSLSDALLDHLRTDTAQRLSLVEAAGIAAFDFSSLVDWSFGIHLFTWKSSRDTRAGSWAIFGSPGLTLNTPPARTWQDARRWLLSEFGLDSLAGRDRPIDVAAQTFAGLMQDARAHYGDGRVREAFLYFVIALDHLLGEDGRSVSTVADRTSVLTHRIRSKTFADEVACVRRVYNTRSRLVHSGSQVTVEDLRETALSRAAFSGRSLESPQMANWTLVTHGSRRLTLSRTCSAEILMS